MNSAVRSGNPADLDLVADRPRAGEPEVERPARIWIEVDDFLRYFDGSLTPTGIGRVQAEIFPHLAERYPDRIRFVRIGNNSRSLALLDYQDVKRLADGDEFLTRHGSRSRTLPLRQFARYVARRSHTALSGMRRAGDLAQFEEAVRPGDVLLNIGASWTHENFGSTIAELKQRHGIRFALMVHDLLPVTHPQFVSRSHIPGFVNWLHSMAEVADLVLTPSSSSANAFAEWAALDGQRPRPVCPVKFGAGFPSSAHHHDFQEPETRKHVLYVSTIEVRKNHILLFRIWERLIAEHGRDAVPQLIFVGKYGWEIDDLKAALSASRFLDGKITVIQNATDGELARLYNEALFTVFPSYCEGWGLPVAESLLHGRYCVASNATSIPEVAGLFAGYHEPTDMEGAYGLIARALYEPGFLKAMERRIREEYQAPGWDGTAEAIMATIDAHLAVAEARLVPASAGR